MAIGTNDNIDKFGTQDQIDDGTTATVATRLKQNVLIQHLLGAG